MIRARPELVEVLGNELVSLAEMRMQLRVDLDDEDQLIEQQIRAARDWAEGFSDRAYVRAKWIGWLDAIPNCPVVLPRAGLEEIDTVHVIDRDGQETLVPTSAYTADLTSQPGLLVPRSGWPAVALRERGGVRVTYIVAPPANPPERVKQAIKLLAADMYEQREESIVGTIVSRVPYGVRALLSLDRVSAV